MKEKVTRFNLEDAFTALNDIEVPKVRGGIRANRVNVHETFRAGRKLKSDLLMEEYYDINDNEDLKQAKVNREADIAKAKLAKIEKIVDLEAQSPEEIQPSYIGKTIIQCPQCMTLFYKDETDIVESENAEVVNVAEECQHCGNVDGYNLIGKVAGINPDELVEEEPAAEEELPEETPVEEEPVEEPAEAVEASENKEEAFEDLPDLEVLPEEEPEEEAEEVKESLVLTEDLNEEEAEELTEENHSNAIIDTDEKWNAFIKDIASDFIKEDLEENCKNCEEEDFKEYTCRK